MVGTFSGWVTATVSRMPIKRLTTWVEWRRFFLLNVLYFIMNINHPFQKQEKKLPTALPFFIFFCIVLIVCALTTAIDCVTWKGVEKKTQNMWSLWTDHLVLMGYTVTTSRKINWRIKKQLVGKYWWGFSACYLSWYSTYQSHSARAGGKPLQCTQAILFFMLP